MENNIPELLVEADFSSPLLYKIYKYLRIIHRNGMVKQPIREFFTENDLMTIIDTLRNCPYDNEFINQFRAGVCENMSMRNRNNTQNRTNREFTRSFIRKNTNEVVKSLYPNQTTDGEIDVLECLFYNYANQVFAPRNNTELGYNGDGVYASFKRKELQLEEMNKLFCNMGNRIVDLKEKTINQALDSSMYRTNIQGNKIYEDIPKSLVTDYLGGKIKLRKSRKSRKSRKTNHKKKYIKRTKKNIRK